MSKKYIGLYLHVPFCLDKCRYCDFYSLACCAGCAPSDRSALRKARKDCKDLFERYTDALLLQMEDYRDALSDCVIDTVYLGGGTPSLLPTDCTERLLEGIYTYFSVNPEAEISIECNPATADRTALKALRGAGINRISIGVQSAVDGELKTLGRLHSFADAKKCFADARAAGFENINVDLMFGLPSQTEKTLDYSIRCCAQLDPEHISLYDLRIEEGTPFARMKEDGQLSLPDEDEDCRMYDSSVKLLGEFGYHQYEISNFAKAGMACRHNLCYWTGGEYLGLGPGAHSCFNGRRFAFIKDVDLFMTAMENPAQPCDLIAESAPRTEKAIRDEYVMLSLRTTRGISTEEYRTTFGEDFEKKYAKLLPILIQNGFMSVSRGGTGADSSGRNYSLTPKGMFVSNYIIAEFTK